MGFGLAGLKVRPSGEDPEDRTSGDHHLIVDGGSIEAGTVIPADARHLHFGKGEAEAEITLPPGTHTLTMQFADDAYRSVWAEMGTRITVPVATATTRTSSVVPPTPTGPFAPAVDCLLSSQLRRLGSELTSVAPRKLVKTSPRDCHNRGGQYVSSGNSGPEVSTPPE